jgi:glycosyltransferase involved in cell wall biosynthesis
MERLASLPNICRLGPRPWEVLPVYLWHCDVGLVPYAADDYNAHRSPLKLFEYLAAGLPVVSTNGACPEGLETGVQHAESAGAFASAVAQAALAKQPQTQRRRRREVLQRRYTWPVRAAELSKLISKLMGDTQTGE